MKLDAEIRATARAIRAECTDIGATELRNRLRERFVFSSLRARFDHHAAVWTSRAHNAAGYLFALLVVSPVTTIWASVVEPNQEKIEEFIESAVVEVESRERGQADSPKE